MLTRFCLTTTLCALPGLASAGGLVLGFRGMEWGDPISKLGVTSTPIAKTQAAQYDCYRRAADKLTINDIPLQEIRYCFGVGKLASVSVQFDKKLAPQIKKAVIEGYGPPVENVGVTFVTWGDDKVQGGGTLALMGHALLFTSNDASQAREVDKIVKARKDF